MGCAALLFIFCHAFPVIGSHFKFNKEQSTWAELSQWLVTRGGWVQDNIQSDLTSHGGAMIRGLVLHAGAYMGSTLIEIPRDLWLHLNFWPDLERASLAHHPPCNDLTKTEVHRLKFAAGLAIESIKGAASEHALYLKHLPPADEYRSFHPSFMSSGLQEDFRSLPTVDLARKMQEDEARMNSCLQSWKHDLHSPVRNIQWNDIEVGLSHLRNRGFIVEEDPIMVPVVDLVNTERSDLVNAEVQFNMDAVSLVVNSMYVGGGQEVLYGYCTYCDNEQMLTQWGVYLEGNANSLPAEHAVDCNSNGNHTATNASAANSKSLKEVSFAALDLGSNVEGKVPRCRQSVFSSEQGPLRCSLARLAWEYCGHVWAQDTSVVTTDADNTEPQKPPWKNTSLASNQNLLKSAEVKKAQSRQVMDTQTLTDGRFIPLKVSLNHTTPNTASVHTSAGNSAFRKRTLRARRL